MPHLSFVKPIPSNPYIQPIPVRFVATLDPPIPVADEICQKLMTVTGIIDVENISSSAVDNTTKTTMQTQSLEDMLVAGVDQDTFNENNEWVVVSFCIFFSCVCNY